MANYYATARSNYFKVKDLEAFSAWCESVGGLQIIHGSEDKQGLVFLTVDEMDGGGWPTSRINPETEEPEDLDFLVELSKHLEPGWVAIIMEVGSEKLRYLNGWAAAVNPEGKTKEVSLDHIYKLAEEMGPNVTRAEY